ncbi:hypothetical protein GQ457_01G017710 [Hibiscus cannabinus]
MDTSTLTWICLNVDGSVCSTTCQVRIGGLFCDGNGSWIEGFFRNIGTTDGLTAKLWAIFDGLTITWKLGFELVQIQLDCSKAISEDHILLPRIVGLPIGSSICISKVRRVALVSETDFK